MRKERTGPVAKQGFYAQLHAKDEITNQEDAGQPEAENGGMLSSSAFLKNIPECEPPSSGLV